MRHKPKLCASCKARLGPFVSADVAVYDPRNICTVDWLPHLRAAGIPDVQIDALFLVYDADDNRVEMANWPK